MDSKKLLKILVALILFILIVNFLANKFHWYFSIWYFDMIMHALGGLWVGFAALYLFTPKDLSWKTICLVLLGVVFVGAGWEAFEFVFYNNLAQNPFNNFDTFSDLFFDLMGGTVAILYYFKRILNYHPLPPPQ